jgi:ligand-binding sensor domain-containing protein
MKGKTQQTLFILLLLSFQWSIAQNNSILFSKFDSLNGTPIGKINAICQDPSGIMWFCGNSQHCFYRYDGNILTKFFQDNNNPNSLGFYGVETIYADDRGLIWIGGDGLDQYNPSTGIFKHYRHSNNDSGSLNGTGVNSILKDHSGNVWIGTNSGLDRLDEKTGKFIHYRNNPSNPKSLSDNEVSHEQLIDKINYYHLTDTIFLVPANWPSINKE